MNIQQHYPNLAQLHAIDRHISPQQALTEVGSILCAAVVGGQLGGACGLFVGCRTAYQNMRQPASGGSRFSYLARISVESGVAVVSFAVFGWALGAAASAEVCAGVILQQHALWLQRQDLNRTGT